MQEKDGLWWWTLLETVVATVGLLSTDTRVSTRQDVGCPVVFTERVCSEGVKVTVERALTRRFTALLRNEWLIESWLWSVYSIKF